MIINGPTIEQTYMLQLKGPRGWNWYSSAEYTDPEDIRTLLRDIYGGAFAAEGMHRIIVVTRTVMK